MKGADSKVNLYKEKGGRLMICHPYFVKKRLATRYSYRKKRTFALSETNKTRFSAQMKQKTGLCIA